MWTLFLDQLTDVLHTFRHHKGRSLLTLLGMIIGAGSMVLLAGLLSGGETALRSTSQGVSEADVIRVDPAPTPQKQRGRTQRPLDRLDQQALGEDPALHLSQAEGVVQRFGATARARGEKLQVMLFGTSERGEGLYRIRVERGRFLDAEDLLRRARVCVVGQEVWRTLLGAPEALGGQTLTVDGVRYEVIGVLAHKPTLGGGRRGNTWDGRVIVPVTTLQSGVRRNGRVDRLFLRVLPGAGDLAALLDPARRMSEALLLRRHYGVANFKVDRDRESKQQEEIIFLVINVLMLATAGLSLFVGGINIMNIMLVTVTERTREIGVRRALGATRGAILRQFLLESAIISTLGGLLGVLGGVALVFASSKGLSLWLETGWPADYKPWAMALGLGTATMTGLVFGLYPAWRAARLDPVEALRYE